MPNCLTKKKREKNPTQEMSEKKWKNNSCEMCDDELKNVPKKV